MKAVPVARGTELHGPNGIVVTDEGIIAVTFGAKTVLAIHKGANKPAGIATLPGGQRDGIERLPDGALFVSSWETKTIYHVTPQGEAHPVMENIESPAGIGYDTKRGRLLVPSFMKNVVEVRKR
jgi:hypothetical protein